MHSQTNQRQGLLRIAIYPLWLNTRRNKETKCKLVGKKHNKKCKKRFQVRDIGALAVFCCFGGFQRRTQTAVDPSSSGGKIWGSCDQHGSCLMRQDEPPSPPCQEISHCTGHFRTHACSLHFTSSSFIQYDDTVKDSFRESWLRNHQLP